MVQLQYEITAAEHLEMVKKRHRRLAQKMINLYIGGCSILLGIVSYRYFGASSVALIVVGSFLFVIPFLSPYIIHRKVYYGNRRLFGQRTLKCDENGIVADTPLGHTETKWSNYEQFRETKNLFLLYLTKDAIGILPKRAFPGPADLELFRTMLASKVRRG